MDETPSEDSGTERRLRRILIVCGIVLAALALAAIAVYALVFVILAPAIQ